MGLGFIRYGAWTVQGAWSNVESGGGERDIFRRQIYYAVHNCSDKVHMHTIDLNTKMAFSIIVP